MPTVQNDDFRLPARDGAALFVRSFLPVEEPRAVVVISHGMAEHSARYARLAAALVERRLAVYAADHRGHGQTAASPTDLGYFKNKGGWHAVVSDLGCVLEEIRSRHPGLPVFLLGHSMGSYIARAFASRHGASLSGLILSGTTHNSPLSYRALKLIVLAERARLGRRGKSALINKLSFEAFNKSVTKPRTAFDWLSRDPLEVDKYVADPLCGFPCTTQLWLDVVTGLEEICEPKNIARIPKSLPIYVIAGEHDPVNDKVRGIRKLHTALSEARLENVTVRIYPEARHELVNETNRQEVTRELIAWLEERLG